MIFEVLILLAGIPVGYLISWLAKDELKEGKKYFRVLVIGSVIGAIGFWIYGFGAVAWSFGFILVISTVGLVKSGDRKVVRRRS